MGRGHDGWSRRDDLETELKYFAGALLVFLGSLALIVGVLFVVDRIVRRLF